MRVSLYWDGDCERAGAKASEWILRSLASRLGIFVVVIFGQVLNQIVQEVTYPWDMEYSGGQVYTWTLPGIGADVNNVGPPLPIRFSGVRGRHRQDRTARCNNIAGGKNGRN